MPPSGLVNAPDGAREPRKSCKRLRMDSSCIRLISIYSNSIQRDISFDTVFDTGSNPIRTQFETF